MRPKVLIVATSQWFTTARLAVALVNAGFLVEALCPPRHPLSKVSVVSRLHLYQGLRPLVSLAQAIATVQPDLIVPGDDRATWHLYELYVQEIHVNGNDTLISSRIRRSIGAPENIPLVHARSSFMKLAQEEGIRVPETAPIQTIAELRTWIARVGFPMILKADGSSGGEGVRIVRSFEEAAHALKVLQAPPLVARAAKRAIIDRDKTLVWASLRRQRSVVNAQTFISGNEANTTMACWEGKVLAELHFEVLNKRHAAGPATVLRLLDNPEMSAAAAKIASRLHLSGLHGLDFMIEANTGNPYLIEMNPRATQVGHLRLGDGRDLAAALFAAVCDVSVQPSAKVTENETIALFPHEWMRDPASTFLRSGYHDVPWDELELIRACVRKNSNKVEKGRLPNWLEGLIRRPTFPPAFKSRKTNRTGLDWETE